MKSRNNDIRPGVAPAPEAPRAAGMEFLANMRMDRRTMLKAAGFALIGLGLETAGCSFARRPVVCAGDATHRRFARVNVTEDRVIRTVAGLRPFRPSGFVVRAERMGEKTVIHNYGHGGGGVTLSWGTGLMAADEAIKTGKRQCAVLGCGCVGLATARLLQARGFDVTIYARDLPPNTTSNVAGAVWSPFFVADPDLCAPSFFSQMEYAARLSHQYFLGLAGGRYGVRWIESYTLSSNPIERSWESEKMASLYPDNIDLVPGQHPFTHRYAQHRMRLFIDMPVYLDALMDEADRAGAKIVVREFESAEDILSLDEPVIMNCTGLGAGKLFKDDEIMPIKGQVAILAPQPEVDYIAVFRDEHLQMLPRTDGIVLGGTFEPGEWSLEPDEAESGRILEGHRRLFDAMGCS